MMKNILQIAILSTGIFMLAACNDKYDKGFNEGYTQGYDEGYTTGDADGYTRGEDYFSAHTTYDQGHADGYATGLPIGYNQGYTVGRSDGFTIGLNQARGDGTYTRDYNRGYNDGYVSGDANGYSEGLDDGYDDGLADGRSSIASSINNAYNNGYNSGYDDGDYDGYSDGLDDGYTSGYDDGFDDSYDVGYSDGYDDGAYDFGFSVGPASTKTASNKVNLLSQVHNDIVDMSKIRMPKVTSKGLVAGGKLIFEETSMNGKDLEKRAAAVEKYVVREMGKQIQANFNLSAERSVKVAAIANHWRKFTSSRAVSSKDADAFATDLIGVNLKQVDYAVRESMKGNAGELNQIMETAATVNETSPANISLIMTKIFMK